MSSVSDSTASYDAVSVPTRHLEVDGVSYAYRQLGPATPADPTPLVFLHRFRATLDDWDPTFVDAVAAQRTVILFSDAAVGPRPVSRPKTSMRRRPTPRASSAP
jgi:pimeloyl-ACP methyl ester carboxylesterase